jgi:hypothetical protein
MKLTADIYNKLMKLIPANLFDKIFGVFQTKVCLISSLFVTYVLIFITMYYEPSLYNDAFNTLLGKVTVFSIIGLAFVRSTYYGYIVALLAVILYFVAGEIIKVNLENPENPDYLDKHSFREGFSWSMQTIDDFNLYNKKVHPKTGYNLQILQEQASEEEVTEYIKTGYWPWTDSTKEMYIKQVERLKMVRNNPIHALDEAMQLYNEAAVKQLMTWNTKEGDFIINGGIATNDPAIDEEVNDGMPEIEHQAKNIIKCTQDKNGRSKMQKTTFNGYNYFNGYKNTKTEDVSNEDIPKEMPGFQFINGPCNPCGPLESPPEYNCPFTLNIKGNQSKKISPIWEQLWGLKEPDEAAAHTYIEKIYDTSDPRKKGFYYGLATGD